jgi:hypothetical protein
MLSFSAGGEAVASALGDNASHKLTVNIPLVVIRL